MVQPMPIVILAGSDRRAASLPEAGSGKHPLSGYKGIEIKVDGRPLVQTVVERLRDCGSFDPIYVVGPARAYREIADSARLIDANGTFGQNIRLAMRQVSRAHPSSPVAFTVCDILPEVEALRRVMEDYAASAPCDLWYPVIRAPEDGKRLGASDWKPRYKIVPAPGQEPVAVLPGHLIVADPPALRLDFLCRLTQLAYRTRNRSIRYRRTVMARGVLFELLLQDLRNLLRLQAPTTTWSVLSAGIQAASALQAGTVTRERLERAARKVVIRGPHRRRHPDRRVCIPILDALSLALDIDTVEEAEEHGGRVNSRSA